jgi:hypothetical protein
VDIWNTTHFSPREAGLYRIAILGRLWSGLGQRVCVLPTAVFINDIQRTFPVTVGSVVNNGSNQQPKGGERATATFYLNSSDVVDFRILRNGGGCEFCRIWLTIHSLF